MTDKLKKFMEEVSKDKTLIDRISKADQSEIIAMAKELNIELTEEDLRKPDPNELSDDELEAVSGGGACGCVSGGYGSDDGLVCICVFGGMGFCSEQSYCTGEGCGACVCPVFGAGATDGKTCVGSWSMNS